MSNDVAKKEEALPTASAPIESGSTCQMNGTGWLKGGLTMAICCATPLLLVGAIAFFGLSLGAIASGALSLAALLVCLVGMFFMMRMMMKDKK
jgi:hypothetical protein